MKKELFKGFITNMKEYTKGNLVGEWVSFPIEEENISHLLQQIGINEENEEYFFSAYSGEFSKNIYQTYGEHVSIEKLNRLAESLEELYWSNEIDKLKAILKVDYTNIEVAIADIDSFNFYPGATLEEVAIELIHPLELPEVALKYFNWEAYQEDLEFDGYTELETGVLYSY